MIARRAAGALHPRRRARASSGEPVAVAVVEQAIRLGPPPRHRRRRAALRHLEQVPAGTEPAGRRPTSGGPLCPRWTGPSRARAA